MSNLPEGAIWVDFTDRGVVPMTGERLEKWRCYTSHTPNQWDVLR